MPTVKVSCSIKDLTKGQRRGTMMECADKKQIRYYGLKKIDKVILDKLTGKKSKRQYTFNEALGKVNGLKTKAKHIMIKIEAATKKGDKEKLKVLQKELDKTKEEYAKIVPIAKKLMQEYEKKQSAESAKLKEASKKTSKKSSKKVSKTKK